jgi:hypothetical protein
MEHRARIFKSQAGGADAAKMAAEGFVTLVFDPSFRARAAAHHATSSLPRRASTTSAAPSTSS